MAATAKLLTVGRLVAKNQFLIKSARFWSTALRLPYNKGLPGLAVSGCHGNRAQLVGRGHPHRFPCHLLSSAQPETDEISKDSTGGEKVIGPSDKHEFQAETRMLLEIVAKSLYSEKEVFIRELISNSSDALEKLRFLLLTQNEKVEDRSRNLNIEINVDKLSKTFTIQDSGVGMSKEGLIQNLGVIARSGSKEFLKQLQGNQSGQDCNIIGQFGVGFYSAFMVANKVEVFTKSYEPGSKGYCWASDGSGSYEIHEAEHVKAGTKIVLHLKNDCQSFCDEDAIKDVIKKYSNFVGSPIFLNGKQANVLQALWLMEPKDVSKEMHTDFYRFISNAFDQPRFSLHYKTDAPLNIRCILYVPEGKPGLFEVSRETEGGVALYCKKVLIKNKVENVLPKWLRFAKGVVDSEDIPLNLSRELLQDSALIRKLRTVLTNRLLRFLNEQARKDPESYDKFYKDYGLFLKEGIVMGHEQLEKEEIAKLIRFESSAKQSGERVSLPEYISRMKNGQSSIYYLAAPSRHLAETSPYFEALKEKHVEVLFCYEPYDELVLLHLREFDKKLLMSVEKEMRQDKEDSPDNKDETTGGLASEDVRALLDWFKNILGSKVHVVKTTKRLSTHPCVVTVEEMGAARHFIRTQFQTMPEEQRYKILEPILEINARHPIMMKLSNLKTANPKLAELIAEQVFDNAMVTAGLIEDPRTILPRMNELLTLALEKH